MECLQVVPLSKSLFLSRDAGCPIQEHVINFLDNVWVDHDQVRMRNWRVCHRDQKLIAHKRYIQWYESTVTHTWEANTEASL